MNIDKEGALVIGEGMMTDSRNQSPEISKVPFCESESLKENVNRCDSYGLCPFLPVASAEMGAQEDRYKKLMKESLIVPYTFTNFCKLQSF